MTTRARDRYPNIAALAQGLMSGGLNSPSLKTEARELLDEADNLHGLLNEVTPDYLWRWLVVIILLLLVSVFLSVVRLGMRS